MSVHPDLMDLNQKPGLSEMPNNILKVSPHWKPSWQVQQFISMEQMLFIS